MADADVAVHGSEDRLVEDAADEAHLAMALDCGAIADRDAGALLSAVLQRVQTEVRQPGHIGIASVDAGDPACFVQHVACRLIGLFVVRARHLR